MARYNLGFYEEENSEIIDLSSIKKLDKFEDLDKFTMQFSNKEELLYYLLDKGLIQKEDFNRKLRVIYKSKETIKFKGIVYSDSKKYFDMDVLSLKYRYKALCANKKFRDMLIEFYQNSSYVSVEDLNNCNDYINSIKEQEKEEILNSIYEEALFIKGNFSYSGFRRLIQLIYKYELKYQKNLIASQENDFKDDSKHDHEPDFVPNSEEEKRYKAYMSYQDKNWDKNTDYFDKFYPTKKI